MDVLATGSLIVGIGFAVIKGIMEIRRIRREHKKTVIAPDNEPLRLSILNRVRSLVHRGPAEPSEHSTE